jgi:sugar phosphate isomerase/epimerase
VTFKVFQSLWGMEGLPFGGEPEWSLREKLDRIGDAGFDGVEIAWSPVFPIGQEALEIVSEYPLEFSIV